jgi:uncharacterized protein YggU (UPF0235/DUF167 family)
MEAGGRLHVRVSPSAGKAGVVGRQGDVWRIRVTSAPERGRATEAALRLLAETLEVPRRNLSLVSGHASRDKLVSVAGLTSSEIEHRLASGTADGRRPPR